MILVINSGSATLKFKLFDFSLKERFCGLVERIGLSNSFLIFNKKQFNYPQGVIDHFQALSLVLNKLEKEQIKIIGHRLVHGGEEFIKPTIVDKKVLKHLEKYNKLAPLHNPANLMGIKVCFKLLPRVKNIAVFDTAFHNTMPDYVYRYAFPNTYYFKYKIRRYGFHGISHQYVCEEAAKKLNKPLSRLNLITCHLGSGCSIAAVKKGKVLETSMGFTPLEGLVMSTRSGDLDPFIPLYLMHELSMGIKEIDQLLNKESGLFGLSGFKDMREVLSAAGYTVPGLKRKNVSFKKKKECRLALKIFIHRLQKYIGAYAAILQGFDALVFTGGIGERSKIVRQLIIKRLKIFFPFKVLVVPANEELMIAQEIKKIIK